MNRYLVVFLLLAVVIGFGATQYSEPKTQPEWKNLKVLPQNISDEKLDSIMDNFKISLGVKCGFCHAAVYDTSNHNPNINGNYKLDFASDAKEQKNVARYMMTMTDSINHKFFGLNEDGSANTVGAIMCYTCHRGNNMINRDDLLKVMPTEEHH